jgi:sugar lactone lactonase YvrE
MKHYVSSWLQAILLLGFMLGATCASAILVQGLSVDDYKFSAKWYPKYGNLRSLAADSVGNVFVASAANNNIQKFSSNGTVLATWGVKGAENGQLNYPEGIAVDGYGYVYVCDQNNNRIQKFTSSGEFLTQWGSLGTGNGQFSASFFIAVDDYGNVYATDEGSNRVQKFTSSGEFITKWGSSGIGDGQFNHPEGIAVDGSGCVYVVETLSARFQKFTGSGGFLSKWGSEGTVIDGQFSGPTGVAVDGRGNIYIADTGNGRIQKFTPIIATVLEVKVVDGAGNPVSGTKVLSEVQPAGQTQLFGLTDVDGLTYFPGLKPGNYKMQIDKTGYVTGSQTIPVVEGQTTIAQSQINLKPVLGKIRVTVKDASGKPISGATVASTIQPSGQPALSGTTGSDGTAQFNDILLGSYTLQASKSGYVSASTQGNAVAESVGELSITLQVQTSGGGIPGFPFESLILGLLIFGAYMGLTRTSRTKI